MDEVVIKDVNGLKEFLDKTKDENVKTLLKELKTITSKEVETFLETDEGQMILLPKLDLHFTESLKTWKENNLEKEFETKLAEEITKRYPEETEEQKRIKVLEESQKQTGKELVTEKLANKANGILTEAKLPLDIVEYLIGVDETTTLTALDKFKTMMEAFQKTLTEKFFKEHGREPKEGLDDTTPLETLEGEYAAAMEKGDIEGAMKVHDKIFKQKQKAKLKTGE